MSNDWKAPLPDFNFLCTETRSRNRASKAVELVEAGVGVEERDGDDA